MSHFVRFASFLFLVVGSLNNNSVFAATSELKSQALAAESSCSNFVRFDDQNAYLGFGTYYPRTNPTGMVKVVEILHPENQYDLATQDGALDVVSIGDRLFVLTFTGLEEWSLSSRSRVATYPTYLGHPNFRYKEGPTGFYLYQDKLYISHGRLGYSVFDIKQNKVVDQKRLLTSQLPLESMAIGIAGAGKTAVLAMDNFTLMNNPSAKGSFRGLIVLDLESGKVTNELPGLDAGAESINIQGDRIFVGFNPAIWTYDLGKVVAGGKHVEPLSVLSVMPKDGMFVGKTAYDDANVYGCYDMMSAEHSISRLPMSFERKTIRLDK